jgi:hypothetical protein
MNLKLVSLVALCGSFAMACGDSGTDTATGGSTPQGGGNADGGNGASSGVLSGGGNDPVGAGTGEGGSPPEAPDCYDDGVKAFFPDGTFSGVTVGQNLCTPAQVSTAYTDCVSGATATQETCDAAIAADATLEACLGCMGGAGDPPVPIPVYLTGASHAYVTLYACQSYALDLPQCAVPTQLLAFCAYLTCEACADDGGTDYSECLDYGLNPPSICEQIVVPDECAPIFAAADLEPECDGADFEEFINNLGNLYCGPPAG